MRYDGDRMTTYEIRPGRTSPCELWSMVRQGDECLWWLPADYIHQNYVCDGTYTYCNEIKERLESK